jgi:hypothetical protein
MSSLLCLPTMCLCVLSSVLWCLVFFYEHLEVKTGSASFLCWNCNGHHNTELRTQRHIVGKHKRRCPAHIVLCFRFVLLRFVSPMLPVSLDCQFLIVPSVFSDVYINISLLNLYIKRNSGYDPGTTICGGKPHLPHDRNHGKFRVGGDGLLTIYSLNCNVISIEQVLVTLPEHLSSPRVLLGFVLPWRSQSLKSVFLVFSACWKNSLKIPKGNQNP